MNPAVVGTIIRVEGRIVDKYIRRGRKYLVLDYVCANDEPACQWEFKLE